MIDIDKFKICTATFMAALFLGAYAASYWITRNTPPVSKNPLFQYGRYAIGIPLIAIMLVAFIFEISDRSDFMHQRGVMMSLGVLIFLQGIYMRTFCRELTEQYARQIQETRETGSIIARVFVPRAHNTDAHGTMLRIGGVFSILFGLGLLLVGIVR